MKLPLRVDTDHALFEVADIVNGKRVEGQDVRVTGVCLDTRDLARGDLFFAIRAARDGHEFVKDAVAKGASAVVVEENRSEYGPRIVVDGTKRALHALARSHREKWGRQVIGISGSNGKTTTKELTASILSSFRSTFKAPGTWNNDLGVPLSLLLLRNDMEFAVLELGINDFGEMTELSSIAKPDVALLTNIGPSHLEKLGSLDGVAKAKGELFDALEVDRTAVIQIDDRHIREIAQNLKCKKVTVSMEGNADVQAKVLEDRGFSGTRLKLIYDRKEFEVDSPLPGQHNVYNLLSACGVAFALNVPAEHIQTGLRHVERPEMRLERLHLKNDLQIINDCYNANPASTMAALSVCASVPAGRHLAVLGDMMELGSFSARAHRDVGIHVAELKFDHLFAVGQFAGDIAQGAIQGGMKEKQILTTTRHDAVLTELKGSLQRGDLVLVKGSRGMKMENITEQLIKVFGKEGTA